MKKIILILIGACFTFWVYPQMNLNDIDFSRIPQKKIKDFINNQIRNHILKFTDLKPSCCDVLQLSVYNTLVKTYLVKDKIENVWSLYKFLSPDEIWQGKMASFGMLYSKRENFIIYKNDNNYKGIETGQILYVNLKFLRGIYNLALAFEIVEVDNTEKVIEFSYVDYGKAKGKQRIQLIDLKDGTTKIIHSTFFKSNSNFRDKVLYPFFHKKAINEFHYNVKKKQIH